MRRFLPTDERSLLDMPFSPGLKALGLYTPKMLVRGPCMGVGGGPRMRKRKAGGYAELSIIGNGVPGVTSVELATHQQYDIAYVIAMRTSAGTAPVTPENWTLVVASGGLASNRIMHLYRRILPGSGTTATGFTNAERCVSWIFRYADQTTPVGATAFAVENNTDPFDVPAITLQRAGTSSSWVCCVGITRAVPASTTIDTGTPTGLYRQGGGTVSTNGSYGYWDTNGPVDSFSAVTLADPGNSAGQMSLSFEVRAAPL